MNEAQIITGVTSDGSCVSIKLERISSATIRFTVAKDYQLVDQENATGYEEVLGMFCNLQGLYFGKMIDTAIRV